MRMGLREANQHFSRVMRAVKAGKEVVLTERGKPIAVLKPIRASQKPEMVIRQLQASGFLRPPARRGAMPVCKPIRIKGGPITKTLREERDAS